MQIESTENSGGGSPIEEWRREAAGMKLRYVPSSHPDMLGLANELVGPDSLTDTRTGAPENVLASTTA